MSDAPPPPPFPPPPPTSTPPTPPHPPAPELSAQQVPSSQRFPTWKQAFVMFGGGLALAISACFGCLFTIGSGGRTNASLEGLSMLLALLAMGGLLATVVGVVLVLMRILRALFSGSGRR